MFLFGIIALFSIGCKKTAEANYDRPHDPWVFRSVLDSIPRMLTVALHDDVWAAYSAETGALYKVWKGSVNFDGAVYTTNHGPQPSTLGDAYFENAFAKPWTVTYKGKAEEPKIQYRGHRFEDGQVTINCELILSDGKVIKLHERPEYVTNDNGQAGLERLFTTENAPKDAQITFKTNISSIALQSSVVADGGTFKITKSEPRAAGDMQAIDVEGELTLKNNGETKLTTYFIRTPLIANRNKIEGAEEEELPLGFKLISKNDCKTCHNTYVKTVGPAYVDVAKKYQNNAENAAYLVGKVVNGGGGVWGEAAMTAHPNLPEQDINEMISYIMLLDSADEASFKKRAQKAGTARLVNLKPSAKNIAENDLLPGAFAKVFVSEKPINVLADINFKQKPTFTGVIPTISFGNSDFEDLKENFAVELTGYLNIPKNNTYVFRLIGDDGVRLLIDNKKVAEYDGWHGSEPRDGEVELAEGYHPFKVQYFQAGGGKELRLQWSSPDLGEFTLIPAAAYRHNRKEEIAGMPAIAMTATVKIPGDKSPLVAVHPSYDLSQARPNDFLPKVGGMDFLPDGRLVVSTWDAEGSVYIVENVDSGDTSKIKYKRIAKGLAEPLGLKVVDGNIYVMQKQELTKLIDHDGDEMIDEYYTVSNAWRVSSNFHEFGFGLAYKAGYFYAALATAILPGGASARPQIPDRGKAVKISKDNGTLEFVAQGLRTPNGVGIGVDGEIFIADNQGDWLPSSKIVHVSQDAFFGSRSVDSVGVANLKEKLPVVWLPQDEIGNSPSTPIALQDGIYKGQMIHGEVTNGGVKRVFVEKVNGEYQGIVFDFIQGLEAGVNRMVYGPDGALYIGGVGNPGNWSHEGKLWYGLQRLKYNGKTAFEMLAVRAKSDGVEIEFTEPLAEGLGWNAAEYDIQQWFYLPTKDYGGPKRELEKLKVLSANVSSDRKKVFLELQGMKPNHVVYVHLPNTWTSENYNEIWTTQGWYTMNQIPANTPGARTQAPTMQADALAASEQKAGFKKLFDGKTLNGWRNYRKQTTGDKWIVEDGAIKFDPKKGTTGGDLITKEEYADFDLRLEWKVAPCANSGIIYRSVESDKYNSPWQTGPEYQVLDNNCHPDAKIEKHKAGDFYDVVASKYIVVKPVGEWNKTRIVVKGNHVEHWLNGRKVVDTEMGTDEWKKLLAASKWKDHPDFSTAKKGHIVLQDHGDVVWFKNIRIKELK